MNRVVSLPMWADIEIDVSLFELYQEYRYKNLKHKGERGVDDPYWKVRMEQINKLYRHLYGKDVGFVREE
jgi:hypothetical protein